MPGEALRKRSTQPRRLAEVHDLAAYREARIREHLEAAQEQMGVGREDEALEHTFRALTLDPHSYDALTLAGTLLAMLGDARASAVYTREAIRVRPERADAYYDLGATLLECDRPEEALQWIELGIARAEGRDDDLCEFLYSARIEALVQLGRLQEAREALDQARSESEGVLGLLDGCEEAIAEKASGPTLRLV